MEKACGKMLFRGLNTNVPNNPLFVENFSNISVFHHNNEVQSLSEGGIPYVIDIEKCETVGRKFTRSVFSNIGSSKD
jgi:carotenoid cleavage dioxygenase-like enzyme